MFKTFRGLRLTIRQHIREMKTIDPFCYWSVVSLSILLVIDVAVVIGCLIYLYIINP
jgi:hypothetical protein